jgi:5-methylcytosine-specific restriction protein A
VPSGFAKICGYPGCRTITLDGTNRCAKHPRKAWDKPNGQPPRMRGRKLQVARSRLFREQPLCAGPDSECEKEGRVTLATERDHRVPLTQGGADDESNEQALCFRCHRLKTERESLNGKRAVRAKWEM